ncbi:MAG: Crp/Fnr family transcriptional regulator [Cocleimonas sp.]|nr:Crp/Fnr family transcriptional regulator [Cocleimonas sp.]
MKKIPPRKQSSCLNCEAREFAWFESVSKGQLVEREKNRTGQYLLAANEHLFIEGDEHHTAYTLKKGWAICYKQLKDGQRQIVHIALAGDFIGYKSEPDEPIDYSVMAVTDCELCSFSEESMSELLKVDINLIHRLIAIQTKQNKTCRKSLSYVGQSQAKNKVAFFLVDLIERLKRRGVDVNSTVDFPLSRVDIADAIGITPVHLGRVSVELSQNEIVECRHNSLSVKNYAVLKNMADSDL